MSSARELGATHSVDASKVDPVKTIREMTGGGVEYAFEAIGLKKAAEQAFECIRPGGTATVIGMIPVGQKLELEGSVFLREKRIQGCSMGSNRFKVDMPKYVDFYQRGLLRRRGRPYRSDVRVVIGRDRVGRRRQVRSTRSHRALP
jgi:S-(hydroxymethyl)glutathione dehydrogenase / alcohol dehydrogenase